MDNLVKVLIVDDHPSYLEGVSMLLQSIMPHASVITALNGFDARSLLKQQPDMDWVLLDINLPDCYGIELIEHFREIKLLANIVVISGDDNPDIIDQALKLHINGFLTKDFDAQLLSKCIQAIQNDQVFLTQKHAEQLRHYQESILVEKLTIEKSISARQKQTLSLIANGYSNLEIADALNISESTVKSHVSSLIALFEADNRTHCVAEARRLNLAD